MLSSHAREVDEEAVAVWRDPAERLGDHTAVSCRLLCALYAMLRFGTGKICLWFSYKTSHNKPTLPIRYIPKERRDKMYRELYVNEGGADEPLHNGTSTKDLVGANGAGARTGKEEEAAVVTESV